MACTHLGPEASRTLWVGSQKTQRKLKTLVRSSASQRLSQLQESS